MEPEPATVNAKRTERGALVAAVLAFAVLAAVSTLQAALARLGNQGDDLGVTIAFGTGIWLGWAILVPPILALGRRFDFSPRRRGRSVAVHAVAALACHVLLVWVRLALGTALEIRGAFETWSRAELFFRDALVGSRVSLSFLTYAAILGLDRALHVRAALRQRELVASRLEAQTVRARLEGLAARLQPHFLFNTLHAIGILVDEDPPRARAMLAELGDLLREVLRDGGAAEIPLREELGLLKRFLDIEQIRFADRLRVETAIAPDAADVLVPRFLLQPLVENALRHGIGQRAAAGTLRIAAVATGGRLRLSVWNDGAPLPAVVREGFGLAATRERLSTRFGPDASVQLRSAEGGVEALVDLPIVAAPAGA